MFFSTPTIDVFKNINRPGLAHIRAGLNAAQKRQQADKAIIAAQAKRDRKNAKRLRDHAASA